MKKGLVFGLIAVVSAALLVTACDTGTSGTETTAAVTPGGVVVDRTVESVDDLVKALADKTVVTVAYILDDDDNTAEVGIIIPAGKTVYLLNPNTTVKTFTPADAGLEVRGTLIVSESTVLAAANGAKVYLGSSGSIRIQDGGELRTEARSSVNDLTDAGVGVGSAIGKVRYAAGSVLTVTSEPGLSVAEIGALLGYLPVAGAARSANDITGKPTTLTLEAPLTAVKPSDIAGIPNIERVSRFVVTPAAAETAAAITIPAGAVVTITQALPTVKTLVVSGTVSAPSVGNGTDAVAVTVTNGAALTVAAAIKFDAAASTIAAGGSFSGSAVEGAEIPAAPGAVVNGSEVKEDEKIVVVTAGSALPAAIEAGKTYQVIGDVEITAATTVSGTLLISNGRLTLGSGGSIADASEGTIILDGGSFTGVLALDTTDKYNPSGLTITHAEKNLKTGDATFTLGGEVTGGITEDAKSNIWADAGDNKPEGNWSWATIVGILPAGKIEANSGIEIKQTNLSLLYYKGSNLNDVVKNVAGKPTSAATITTSGPASIYLDPNNTWAIKWAKYGEGRNPQDGAGFGVLLWSGANPKTATIEITPKDGTSYTVTVDWSGVTINS
jgi:hypothetical protein